VIPFSDVNGTPATVLSADDIISGRTNISQGITGLADEGGDYNASSSLIAVYESVENKIWEKFRLIWGFRFEKYQQSANIFNAVYYNGFTGPEPIVRNFASRTEFNLLPSVNAVYSPVSSVNIRAAFSATVIRPDLKDIVGIPTFDVTNFRLTYGNPELKSTAVTNYDLKFEWFPSAGEIMSASYFYKNILNPIEYVIPFNQVQYPDVSGVPVNTGKAFVRGIELEIRKKIDFIDVLPFLKNVTLFGNSTILQSKVFEQQLQSIIIPRVTEHRLTGQPNLIINAGINILAFKNSLDFTFTFNRSGDYIGELGSLDKFVIDNDSRFPGVSYTREQRVPNLFVRRRNLLDFVISKSFYKNKAKMKLNIGNILREPFILYQDLNNNKRFDTPLVIASGPNKIGSSYNVPNPGLYRGGIDNTATRLTGQRLYEFTLSYTF
jgi:outer membrane receptor protein involved in Fe transport